MKLRKQERSVKRNLCGGKWYFSISKLHEKSQMASDFDEHFFGEWSEFRLAFLGGW